MLEFSTSTGYALLALGYLARCPDRWVLAKEIAQHTQVAGPYLSRILHTLEGAGFVTSKRGYQGGFQLARPAAQIAILDIVEAVEREPRISRCLLGLAQCSDETDCPLHDLWKTARARIESRLAKLRLNELTDSLVRRFVEEPATTDRAGERTRQPGRRCRTDRKH